MQKTNVESLLAEKVKAAEAILRQKEQEKEQRLKSVVLNVIEKEEALERAQVAQVAAVDSFKL